MEEELREEFEEEPKKKWLAILAGIFLLLIVIVYFLPGDVFSVLQGRLESSKLEGFTAEYDDGSVVYNYYAPEVRNVVKTQTTGVINDLTDCTLDSRGDPKVSPPNGVTISTFTAKLLCIAIGRAVCVFTSAIVFFQSLCYLL